MSNPSSRDPDGHRLRGADVGSTKSLVPVLGAVLLGAIVIYRVQNDDFLEQKVEEDFERGARREGRRASDHLRHLHPRRRHPMVLGNIGRLDPAVPALAAAARRAGRHLLVRDADLGPVGPLLPADPRDRRRRRRPVRAGVGVRRARIEGRTLARLAVGYVAVPLSTPRHGRAGRRCRSPVRGTSAITRRTSSQGVDLS